MKLENMTISLEEFIKYLLNKWKIIGCSIVVCTALFCGSAVMLGEEIYVPHSEEYLFYEDALARHLRYVDESVLMTLDPTCIYERTLFLKDISNEEALHDYVQSLEIWDELETDRTKKYLPELLTWNKNETSGDVQLILRHGTSEECETWINYISDRLKAFDPQVKTSVGKERIVADEDVQLEKLRRYTRTEHIKSLWLESQAGYTLKVSIVGAVFMGVLSGGIVSVFGLLVWYVIKEKSGKKYD